MQTDKDREVVSGHTAASYSLSTRMLRSELTRCKAQLESRDCRIRELREALSAPAVGMDMMPDTISCGVLCQHCCLARFSGQLK